MIDVSALGADARRQIAEQVAPRCPSCANARRVCRAGCPAMLAWDIPDACSCGGRRCPGCRGGKWRAWATTVDGILFRSQTEARVFERVRDELLDGQKLVIDCRFPLVATAPRIGKAAKAGYITIDLTVWRPDVIGEEIVWVLWRAIDAKPRSRAARSRDWRRGARAFTATYGIQIEECDR